MKHQFKTVEWDTPQELETTLLQALDLTRLRELWEEEDEEIQTLTGRDYFVCLAPAKNQANGVFVAELKTLHPSDTTRHRDWPRYYFDLNRARCEIEAWMIYNGQVALPDPQTTKNEPQNAA